MLEESGGESLIIKTTPRFRHVSFAVNKWDERYIYLLIYLLIIQAHVGVTVQHSL